MPPPSSAWTSPHKCSQRPKTSGLPNLYIQPQFLRGRSPCPPLSRREFSPGHTCRRTAHHFSDIHQVLQEIWRILPAGGRLIVDDRSVPEDDFAFMNKLDRYHDEAHIRQYRPTEWRRMLRTAGFSVEAVEPYTQHRPLAFLIDGVSPENVQHIHNRLNGLNAQQQKKLSLTEKDEQLYSNHWYVTIAAVKQEEIP